MKISIPKDIFTNPLQKSSSRNDDETFLLFISRILSLGVALIVVAALLDLMHFNDWKQDALNALSFIGRGLGEALIIAYLVAVVVEPYMRSWYASQTATELWWAVQRKNVPDEMRHAITSLAKSKEFYRRTTWKMRFDRTDDGQLEVELEVNSTGTSIDEPVHPDVGLWLMSSSSKYKARHIAWRLEIPDDDASWVIDEDDFLRIDSGELEVSSLYPDDVKVPAGKTYTTKKLVRVYPAGDWLPLRTRCMTGRFFYDISGPAADGLEFSVKHPDGTTATDSFKNTGKKNISFESPAGSFTLPGHVSLVSWTPTAAGGAELGDAK
ncbi:hypothetical protein [Streptomyces sp. NBC_00354]|uniref:hypothetical protein n=1 Tax=Streptomyces sp. NBC_00354 TaxID=2975723 RepID=UPI002E2554A3